MGSSSFELLYCYIKECEEIMKKYDKIIIVAVFLISILGLAFTRFSKDEYTEGKIVVQVGSEITKEIPLQISDKSKIHEFSFKDNTGYIEVKDGKVRVLEMDKKICPEGICSDTGWIDSEYQLIVCLPNEIIVTIEGVKDEGQI